jgi:4-alpha-glucanotransferase
LKRYCDELGIRIIGDVPIYVAYDSADVWAQSDIFKLTKTKRPRFVSGVPPDLFSRTGQLWGNPVFDWQVLQSSGYRWWLERIRHNLRLFDIVRIDHFRGFIAYWQLPASAKTAIKGKWVKGPGADFFKSLFKNVSSASIIVEDLGHITSDVTEVIDKFGLASMRVLLFAFEGDPAENVHCPHNHARNSVVYTGTHDNNTLRGWFETEAKLAHKKRLVDCLGHKVSDATVHWQLIRLAMSSVADRVIIPMQDILGLGAEARMNRPATIRGNWRWRLATGTTKAAVARRLANMTEICGRG